MPKAILAFLVFHLLLILLLSLTLISLDSKFLLGFFSLLRFLILHQFFAKQKSKDALILHRH
jgi:hypothetical protein